MQSARKIVPEPEVTKTNELDHKCLFNGKKKLHTMPSSTAKTPRPNIFLTMAFSSVVFFKTVPTSNPDIPETTEVNVLKIPSGSMLPSYNKPGK